MPFPCSGGDLLTISSLAKDCVEERLRPGAKPGLDMLQGFIDAGMTHDELIQHMFVQM